MRDAHSSVRFSVTSYWISHQFRPLRALHASSDSTTLHAYHQHKHSAHYCSLRAFRIYRMDQIMTAETFKLGQSAKLWNWFDRMRFDHQRHSVKDSCKVKFDQAGGSVADITAITDPAARCLTQDESPAKRRWNAKRMRRPVSCYVFTSGNVEVERKYRSHYETHFPSSKPIPQRVRAAKSIQNLTSVDTIDRQVIPNMADASLRH